MSGESIDEQIARRLPAQMQEHESKSSRVGSSAVNDVTVPENLPSEQKKKRKAPTKTLKKPNTPKQRKISTKNTQNPEKSKSYAAAEKEFGRAVIIQVPISLPSPEELKKERATQLEEYANQIWTFPVKHHIYTDPGSGEVYDAKLVHVNLRHNKTQKITLRLYESDSAPHTYATYMLDSMGNENTIVHLGSTWEDAFNAFKKEFKRWTAWTWDDRMKALGEWPPGLIPSMMATRKPYLYAQAKYHW
jgi:hypothetical protein